VISIVDRIALAEDVRAGEYNLAVGIVSEDSAEPVARLAIKGRSLDGWYPLSRITISRR